MYTSQSEHDVVECPYDKTHRVLRKRLQVHLLRCRQVHPDAELQKCPFNAVHLIPEPEYVHHVSNCPDRKLLTQYIYNNGEKPVEHEIIRHPKIEDEENWDEIEIEAPDFKPTKLAVPFKREKLCMIKPIKTGFHRHSRTRSRTRSPPVSRSRSRSPLANYPLIKKEHIEPKREYIEPKKEYIEPKKEYIEPYRNSYGSKKTYFEPKREPESPPRPSYSRSSYTSYQNDSSASSSRYSNYTNRRNTMRHTKKEPIEVEFYDLDDDPYYNGGC